MQVTNGDIVRAKDAMKELLKQPLPVKTAYWLTKLVRKMEETLRDVETVRVRLVQEYGSPHADGGIVVAPDGARFPKFKTAFEELMAETVALDGLPMDKITLPSDPTEDCRECPTCHRRGLWISAEMLFALEPFVEVQ